MNFSELQGKTLNRVTGSVGAETLDFEADDGAVYRLFHDQDCCENVRVEDIAGDLADLVGAPILLAEESSSGDGDSELHPPGYEAGDSFTWTFYRLRTNKGDVTIRWLGTSHGYYSERVSFGLVGSEDA